MKSSICLAMIVKNEAESIAETIASARPIVDRILILDTGSTDGTPEIARAAFGEVVGTVVHGEFVDFSTTRNQAIELAEQSGATFVLMLSGNETLQGDLIQFRRFLEAEEACGAPAYNVRCVMGNLAYESTRVSRTGAGWRYVGPTHEVMLGPNKEPASIVAPGVTVFHDTSKRTRDKCIPGWQRDANLLHAAVEKDPKDTRSMFYLAQSYEMLQKYPEAIDKYLQRIELGGWAEEVFISALRVARIMQTLHKPWALVQDAYLHAYMLNTARAEPLYEIGKHYYDLGQHHIAYMFFLAAAEIPYPSKGALFIEPEAYQNTHDYLGTSAWYSGHYKVGEEAVREALRRRPGDSRLLQNLAHYEGRRQPDRKLTEDLDVVALRNRLGGTPVVVSLTTIPSRWGLLRKALDSLVAQRFKPDAIYVVVPEVSLREGVPYEIPSWLNPQNYPGVTILRVNKDYGPATKLFGPLQTTLPGEAIIATFDDDSEYEEHVLEKLVDRAIRYPNAAIGFSGINVEKLIREGEYELVYEQFGRRPQDPTPANVIEGYCGAAYRRRFFDVEIYNTLGFPPDTFFVDDFWFSGYLARKGIQKLIFHYSDVTLTREDVWFKIWKQNGLNTDSNPLHLISDFKEKNRRVAQAFKAKDPTIWTRELGAVRSR